GGADDETSVVPGLGALAGGAAAAGAVTELTEAAPAGAAFAPAGAAPVPLARSSARVTPQRSAIPPPPSDESWGARRRRLGIPRRLTLRVLLFLILVLAVPTAAHFVIRWYAYDNWFLALSGNQVVVKQGQPGGVLWFKPKVVDRTGITTAHILPPGITEIKNGVQEPSLHDAVKFVRNLNAQYNFLHGAANAGETGVGP